MVKTEKNTPTARREYRRATNYPCRMSLTISESMNQTLNKYSDAYGVSRSDFVRGALECGIPIFRNRLTTRKRRAKVNTN